MHALGGVWTSIQDNPVKCYHNFETLISVGDKFVVDEPPSDDEEEEK
jgi:hypothetical protein